MIAGDDGDQVGAPHSRVVSVSVKTAGANGATDVAEVIADIDWERTSTTSVRLLVP